MAMLVCTLEGEMALLPGDGIGDRGAGIAERRVVGRGLVEAVVEVVEQALLQAEGGADGGGAVADGVPCEADARLGQELRAVVGERGGADGGIGVDHAVGELIVRGAAIGFVPAIAAFDAEAGAEFETRRCLPDVFDVARAEPRAPVERRG